MNVKNCILVASLFLFGMVTAHAGDLTSNNNATSSASTNAQAGSYNGGNNIITNNPGTVAYSGHFTQRNVPSIAMGAFSSSFSSDYCSGTMQVGASIAGAGIGIGKQKLDEGCQLLRSADMTMRVAQVYSADAAAEWKFSNELGPLPSAQKFADEVRKTSFAKAAKADALKDASVNMVCAVSDKVRQAMIDAGVECPKH